MYKNQNNKSNSAKCILLWIAENFTPIDKIEQAATGYTYCEIVNKCHPNSIAMSKVKFINSNNLSNNDHDSVMKNYKLLQSAFIKNKIDKHFDISKLMKGKFQDNLQFLQWFKNYYYSIFPLYTNKGLIEFNNILNSSHSNIEFEENKSYNSNYICSSLNLNNINSKKIYNSNSKKLCIKDNKKQENTNNKNNNKENKNINNNSNNNNNNSFLTNKINSAKKFVSCEIKNQINSNLNTNIDESKSIVFNNKNEDNYESIIKEYDNELVNSKKENEDLSKIIIQQNKEIESNNNIIVDLRKVINLVQKERDFFYSKLRDIEALVHYDNININNIQKILSSDVELEVIPKLNDNNKVEVTIKSFL